MMSESASAAAAIAARPSAVSIAQSSSIYAPLSPSPGGLSMRMGAMGALAPQKPQGGLGLGSMMRSTSDNSAEQLARTQAAGAGSSNADSTAPKRDFRSGDRGDRRDTRDDRERDRDRAPRRAAVGSAGTSTSVTGSSSSRAPRSSAFDRERGPNNSERDFRFREAAASNTSSTSTTTPSTTAGEEDGWSKVGRKDKREETTTATRGGDRFTRFRGGDDNTESTNSNRERGGERTERDREPRADRERGERSERDHSPRDRRDREPREPRGDRDREPRRDNYGGRRDNKDGSSRTWDRESGNREGGGRDRGNSDRASRSTYSRRTAEHFDGENAHEDEPVYDEGWDQPVPGCFTKAELLALFHVDTCEKPPQLVDLDGMHVVSAATLLPVNIAPVSEEEAAARAGGSWVGKNYPAKHRAVGGAHGAGGVRTGAAEPRAAGARKEHTDEVGADGDEDVRIDAATGKKVIRTLQALPSQQKQWRAEEDNSQQNAAGGAGAAGGAKRGISTLGALPNQSNLTQAVTAPAAITKDNWRSEAAEFPPQQQQQDEFLDQDPAHSYDEPRIPAATMWYYKDPQGDTQGPFTDEEMRDWYEKGYFDLKLLVQCDIDFSKPDAANVPFAPLGVWFLQGKKAFLEEIPPISVQNTIQASHITQQNQHHQQQQMQQQQQHMPQQHPSQHYHPQQLNQFPVDIQGLHIDESQQQQHPTNAWQQPPPQQQQPPYGHAAWGAPIDQRYGVPPQQQHQQVPPQAQQMHPQQQPQPNAPWGAPNNFHPIPNQGYPAQIIDPRIQQQQQHAAMMAQQQQQQRPQQANAVDPQQYLRQQQLLAQQQQQQQRAVGVPPQQQQPPQQPQVPLEQQHLLQQRMAMLQQQQQQQIASQREAALRDSQNLLQTQQQQQQPVSQQQAPVVLAPWSKAASTQQPTQQSLFHIQQQAEIEEAARAEEEAAAQARQAEAERQKAAAWNVSAQQQQATTKAASKEAAAQQKAAQQAAAEQARGDAAKEAAAKAQADRERAKAATAAAAAAAKPVVKPAPPASSLQAIQAEEESRLASEAAAEQDAQSAWPVAAISPNPVVAWNTSSGQSQAKKKAASAPAPVAAKKEEQAVIHPNMTREQKLQAAKELKDRQAREKREAEAAAAQHARDEEERKKREQLERAKTMQKQTWGVAPVSAATDLRSIQAADAMRAAAEEAKRAEQIAAMQAANPTMPLAWSGASKPALSFREIQELEEQAKIEQVQTAASMIGGAYQPPSTWGSIATKSAPTPTRPQASPSVNAEDDGEEVEDIWGSSKPAVTPNTQTAAAKLAASLAQAPKSSPTAASGAKPQQKQPASSPTASSASSSSSAVPATPVKSKPAENTFGGPQMSLDFENWCRAQLTKISGSSDVTLAHFLLTLESRSQIEEYIKEYLGSTPETAKFASGFLKFRDAALAKTAHQANVMQSPLPASAAAAAALADTKRQKMNKKK